MFPKVVLVLEYNDSRRARLVDLVRSRGCDVIAFADTYSYYHAQVGSYVHNEQLVPDLVITGRHLSAMTGIEFVENINAGVSRGLRRQIGIIATDWPAADLQKARVLGCMVFEQGDPDQIDQSLCRWLEGLVNTQQS